MEPMLDLIQEQLADRRNRLAAAAAHSHDRAALDGLLRDVDAALARVESGTYGVCESCHGAVEPERLLSDPLTRVCLDCLSPAELRALERDIETAAKIQTGLLPPSEVSHGVWSAAYRYQPARLVSGDYCDLLPTPDGRLHFLLGDVAGKGIGASMVMAQLHAMFRTLMPLDLPLVEIVGRASRLLCESTISTHYATLVCGTLEPSGALSLCNAGHPPGLLVHEHDVTCLESTGLPLGMFCDGQYTVAQASMGPGDTLLLYTDGVTEAPDAAGTEYGGNRLLDVVRRHRCDPLSTLLDACVADVAAHRGAAPVHDDLTLMALGSR
jgi:sigma-B regulation protein RsbU (phosphoserine phosphatase)